jgi:enamine deaminase RidA (YjgF/YER057c/UK114 family)
MSSVESRLRSAGIALPEVPAPVAAYVPSVLAGGFVYTAGQIPRVGGELLYPGHVGADVTVDEAKLGAQRAALQAMAALKAAVGNLDSIRRIVKVTVFVASAPGFTGQPSVADGASELFQLAFVDAGIHARSAVGVAELPLGSSVEVEVVAHADPA